MVKSTEQPKVVEQTKPKPRQKRRALRRTPSVDETNLEELLSLYEQVLDKHTVRKRRHLCVAQRTN
jgi:hypothetical protein